MLCILVIFGENYDFRLWRPSFEQFSLMLNIFEKIEQIQEKAFVFKNKNLQLYLKQLAFYFCVSNILECKVRALVIVCIGIDTHCCSTSLIVGRFLSSLFFNIL